MDGNSMSGWVECNERVDGWNEMNEWIGELKRG